MRVWLAPVRAALVFLLVSAAIAQMDITLLSVPSFGSSSPSVWSEPYVAYDAASERVWFCYADASNLNELRIMACHRTGVSCTQRQPVADVGAVVDNTGAGCGLVVDSLYGRLLVVYLKDLRNGDAADVFVISCPLDPLQACTQRIRVGGLLPATMQRAIADQAVAYYRGGGGGMIIAIPGFYDATTRAEKAHLIRCTLSGGPLALGDCSALNVSSVVGRFDTDNVNILTSGVTVDEGSQAVLIGGRTGVSPWVSCLYRCMPLTAANFSSMTCTYAVATSGGNSGDETTIAFSPAVQRILLSSAGSPYQYGAVTSCPSPSMAGCVQRSLALASAVPGASPNIHRAGVNVPDDGGNRLYVASSSGADAFPFESLVVSSCPLLTLSTSRCTATSAALALGLGSRTAVKPRAVIEPATGLVHVVSERFFWYRARCTLAACFVACPAVAAQSSVLFEDASLGSTLSASAGTRVRVLIVTRLANGTRAYCAASQLRALSNGVENATLLAAAPLGAASFFDLVLDRTSFGAMTFTLDGAQLPAPPLSVSITPGPLSAENSLIDAPAVTLVSVPVVLTVRLRDVFGNERAHSGGGVSLTLLRNNVPVTAVSPAVHDGSAFDRYSISFVEAVTGTFIFSVQLADGSRLPRVSVTISVVCAPGTSHVLSTDPCLPCARDTCSSTADASACVPCPPLMSTSGMTGCRNASAECVCKPGAVLLDPARIELGCACPPGTFAAASSLPCSPCPANTYYAGSQATSCSPCPPLMITNGTGATSADECICKPAAVLGNPSAPQLGCVCPPGFAMAAADLPCLPCLPNTFTNTSNMRTCLSCPRQSATAPGAPLGSANSAAACLCKSGARSRDTGALSGDACACPPGTTSESDDAPCLLCPANTFMPNWDARSCRPCPLNAPSLAGASAFGNCTAPPGYLASLRRSEAFAACPYGSLACADGACRPGYTGLLCKDCQPGYSPRGRALGCSPCPAGGGALTWLLLPVAAVLAVIMYAAALLTNYRSSSLSTLRAASKMPASISLSVANMQIVGMLGLAPFEWPSEVRAVFAIFRLSSLDIASFSGCTLTRYEAKFLIIMLGPLVVLGFFALLHPLARICMLRPPGAAGRPGGLFETMRTAILISATLAYLPLTSTVLGFFACTQLDEDGRWYLDADYSFVCYEAVWRRYLVVALLGLIVYVIGLPLSIGLVLARKKSLLYSDERTTLALAPLFRSFRAARPLWAVVMYVKRLFIAAAALYLAFNPQLSLIAFLAIFVASSYYHHVHMPFFAQRHNRLEGLLSLGLVLVVLAGLVFLTTGSPADTRFSADETGARLADEVRLATLVVLMLVLVAMVAVMIWGAVADILDARASSASKVMSTQTRTFARLIRSYAADLSADEIVRLIDATAAGKLKG